MPIRVRLGNSKNVQTSSEDKRVSEENEESSLEKDNKVLKRFGNLSPITKRLMI